MNPELSIIIPVHNEQENVRILYGQIRESVDALKKRYEIIFIDDGSRDNSLDVLKRIKEEEDIEKSEIVDTRIICFTRNFGQTAAMQAGFEHAKGDFVVSLDGDLQNDPKDIPKILDKLSEGYDVVCGWRKERKDKTLTRIIPSRVANWLIGKITGVPIHDNGCSLKAYRSFVIKSVRLYSDMHRFIPAMSTLVGSNIGEMVVNHRPRSFGRTKYGLNRIWKVLFDIIAVKMLIHFRERPLWWFALSGFVFFILGFGFAMASLVLYLRDVKTVIYSGASILFFFLFGSLLMWGFLAEFFVKVEKSIHLRQIDPDKQ